jgi:hypothetical protein
MGVGSAAAPGLRPAASRASRAAAGDAELRDSRGPRPGNRVLSGGSVVSACLLIRGLIADFPGRVRPGRLPCRGGGRACGPGGIPGHPLVQSHSVLQARCALGRNSGLGCRYPGDVRRPTLPAYPPA